MKHKKRKQLTALILTAALLCGCAAGKNDNKDEAAASPVSTLTQEEVEEVLPKLAKETEDAEPFAGIGERPSLMKAAAPTQTELVPCAEPYTVEPDLGNVENLWQFYFPEDDEMVQKLSANGFVVCGNAGSEFFEVYESNRYSMIPNFVTVDSMMHTYHIYFSYLLKNLEKNYLSDSISQLSKRMLTNSLVQYDSLKGSEWENAAKCNAAFFTIGAKLLDDSTEIDADVADIVQYELDHIYQASGIEQSQITGGDEDYSQYKPRGYYEGDDALEAYFRAMMWYGRIHFMHANKDHTRSALLITEALNEDAEAYQLWESVYAVTSFFAGASDDLSVCEYAPIMKEVYGENPTTEDLAGNADGFSTFYDRTAQLPVPQINSIPIQDGENNIISGFRFMGQRFTIDASIMQKLIYRNVGANKEGETRMLPDVLDVPAALGSDTALEILTESGAADYQGYSENMDKLRESLSNADDTLWSASLYTGWLNTLRPLLEEKGEGYPVFMQSREWSKKDLECFAGSFTELKHDTVLYSKQVMAEMGGGMDEEPDDRGYVEPEPLVYERFAALSSMTAEGLKAYGMLSSADEENLSLLTELAGQLLTISKKELSNEPLTDEEYELIRCFGGNLEHFWYETMTNDDRDEGASFTTKDCPAAIVVDIATDPNGTVLEAATGDPSMIYVVIQVEGKIKIATGSVYSFYQFAHPIDDRLTDTKWRVMMGIQADENGNYNYDKKIDRPEWTKSYRYQYEWE